MSDDKGADLKVLEHHAHELGLYSIHCGHTMKYFEKGYDVKRALLLKAYTGPCAQGEWDTDRYGREAG